MKPAAIIALILFLAALGGVGYLYTTCQITVVDVGAQATAAADQPTLFDELKTQQERQEVIGTSYSKEELTAPEDYQFLTYSIRLSNTCFIPADNVEVQVTPMAGDVLQIGDTAIRTLPARATGDISATILTHAGSQPVRELMVTYYLWGIPFSVRTMYSTN